MNADLLNTAHHVLDFFDESVRDKELRNQLLAGLQTWSGSDWPLRIGRKNGIKALALMLLYSCGRCDALRDAQCFEALQSYFETACKRKVICQSITIIETLIQAGLTTEELRLQFTQQEDLIEANYSRELKENAPRKSDSEDHSIELW